MDKNLNTYFAIFGVLWLLMVAIIIFVNIKFKGKIKPYQYKSDTNSDPGCSLLVTNIFHRHDLDSSNKQPHKNYDPFGMRK